MIRLIIFGHPGSPVYELGDRLSTFHNLSFFTIEKDYEHYDSYWTDKIESTDFDTGDFSEGSESQHMVRDPSSLRLDRELEQADPSIPPFEGVEDCLDESEMFYIFQMNQGIVATEIPDRKLIEWATHVIFLEANESNVIDWFGARRHCPTCRGIYHLEDKVPVTLNRCDRDGSDLLRKDEDAPDNIRQQFKDWRNSFWKFEETAKNRGIYKRINIDKMRDFDDLVSRVNLWTRSEIEKMESWWDTALDTI